jgi:hypothetical protein
MTVFKAIENKNKRDKLRLDQAGAEKSIAKYD